MIDSAIFAFGKCDWDRVTERQRNAKIRVEGVPDIRVKDSGLRPTAMIRLLGKVGRPSVLQLFVIYSSAIMSNCIKLCRR